MRGPHATDHRKKNIFADPYLFLVKNIVFSLFTMLRVSGVARFFSPGGKWGGGTLRGEGEGQDP